MAPEEELLRISKEDGELFTPVCAETRRGALEAAAAAPAIRAPGFAGGTLAFAARHSVGGKQEFHACALTLEEPLHESGPLVFWELQTFYYGLGFSKASDDLCRYLRRERIKNRLNGLLDDLYIDREKHFRPSIKMAVHKDKDVTQEHLAKFHRAEAMVSTRYLVAFLLMMTQSSVTHVKQKAAFFLEVVTDIAEFEPTDGLDLSELVPCHVSLNSQCHHVTAFNKALAKDERGSTWPLHRSFPAAIATAHSLLLKCECIVLTDIRGQLLAVIADFVDDSILGGQLRSSPKGLEFRLCRKGRLPRQANRWLGLNLTFEKKGGQVIVDEGGKRSKCEFRREAEQIGCYHLFVSDELSHRSRIASSMDASMVCGDMMTYCVGVPELGEWPEQTLWLPPKV